MDILKLQNILATSPSVEFHKTKNKELIILFFADIFSRDIAVTTESIHYKLADYLEERNIAEDDENEIKVIDTYEEKAKKYIQLWANKGFLTNYKNDTGEIFYELSSYSSKTIDWLTNLKKQEYIGTESRFKTLFNQLKELVEFTNEHREEH